jgi:hypothetical protein
MRTILLICFLLLNGTGLAAAKTAHIKSAVTGPWTSGNEGNSSSVCPDAYHAIGVNVQGASSTSWSCAGCVQKLQVVCAPDPLH